MKPLLGLTALFALCALAGARPAATAAAPIRVVVWDERQPAQKEAYPNFLGNAIADYLKAKGGDFTVRSVGIDDPDQGLPAEVLDNCDVLVWWGHQRHDQVKDALVSGIVDRVKAGRLNLLALHSAHWSKPFIAAMNERQIQDALKSLTAEERKKVTVKTIPAEKRLTKPNEPPPSFSKVTNPDGTVILEVKLPMCVFPVVRNDGKTSHVAVKATSHPIMRGVPAQFDIPKEEVYGGPFHVPAPDVLLFEESWDAGDRFMSGCLWSLGKGKVVYLRPGHETYPIYRQPEMLQIVENAVRFLGTR